MKNLRVTYALVALSILFLSCETEEPTTLEEASQEVDLKEGPYTMLPVSMSEIPEITGFLNSKANKDIFSKSPSSKKETGAIIDQDEILKVTDTLGQTNYSFRFTYADTPETEFYNLAVGVSSDGQAQEPIVLKYTCDPEYYQEFADNGFDLMYFVGSIDVYPFDSFFKDTAFGKSNCRPRHDQNGDPISCFNTRVTNGSSGGGAGSSVGGPNNGPISSATGGYNNNISVTVYHVIPDGRTYTYGSGSTCQHPGECNIIIQVSTTHTRKGASAGKDCPKCNINTSGVAVNARGRTKYLAGILKSRLRLSSREKSFLLKNPKLVEDLTKYLNKHKYSSKAKSFAKGVVKFSSAPILSPQTTRAQLYSEIRIYTGVISKYGNPSEKQLASYLKEVNKSFSSFSNEELYDYYLVTRGLRYTMQKNRMKVILFTTIKTFQPVLEFALLEVGGSLAIKFLSKLPAVVKTAQITKVLSSLKVASSLSKFKYAQKFGIKTYAEHVKFFDVLKIKRSKLGVEVHHLIEKRFAPHLKLNEKKMKSIVLTKAEHANFTKAWRNRIGHKDDGVKITTRNATPQDIRKVAKAIYEDYPEILKALGL